MENEIKKGLKTWRFSHYNVKKLMLIHLLDGLGENAFYGQWTRMERLHHNSSADTVKQS